MAVVEIHRHHDCQKAPTHSFCHPRVAVEGSDRQRKAEQEGVVHLKSWPQAKASWRDMGLLREPLPGALLKTSCGGLNVESRAERCERSTRMDVRGFESDSNRRCSPSCEIQALKDHQYGGSSRAIPASCRPLTYVLEAIISMRPRVFGRPSARIRQCAGPGGLCGHHPFRGLRDVRTRRPQARPVGAIHGGARPHGEARPVPRETRSLVH